MKLPSISKPQSAQSARQKQGIQNLEKALFDKISEYDQMYRSEEIKKVENPYKKLQFIDEPQRAKTTITNPKPILKKKAEPHSTKELYKETAFVTAQEPVESESSSEDSADEIIKNAETLQRQKKNYLVFDKSDIGQMNKMIFDAQNDMLDHTKSIVNINAGIKQLCKNSSIDQGLIENLNRAYKEMIRLSRESDIMEEYFISQAPKRNGKRSGSLQK